MANLPNNGSKSDPKMNKQGATFLENAVSKIQERRCDLTNRQQYLKEKISALERSIPALMAFNMWTSGSKCDGPPLCKIRQIMGKLSPNNDPSEKLVDNLRKTVESLNMETTELHDKIIAADIKLQESKMELESIELENKEIDKTTRSLEGELNKKKSPSLHSIHSEDLFCLAKIRELGEEEINLKNTIRELEERETIFQEQINRILTSREFQKSMCNDVVCEKKNHSCSPSTQMKNSQEMKKRHRDTGSTGKQVPTSSKERSADDKSTRKRPGLTPAGTSNMKYVEMSEATMTASPSTREGTGGKEKSTKPCARPVSATTGCYDKFSCSTTSKTSNPGRVQSTRKSSPCRNPHATSRQQSVHLSVCSSKPCCSIFTGKQNASKGKTCPACCKNLSSSIKSSCKSSNPSTCIKWKCCKGKFCCQMARNAKFAGSTTCKKCFGVIPPSQEGRDDSSHSCKGKCARAGSNLACNCFDNDNAAVNEDHKSLRDPTKFNDQQSSTDEEYSECCDCGCNGSDFSSESF